MGINIKTFKRWKLSLIDKRKGTSKTPANKLTTEEVDNIVKISTSSEFMDIPPSQIVPTLADQGKYVASEATFYRILNAHNMLKHRGKSKKAKHKKPKELIATGINQIYSWDITYLKGPIRGSFYYLYLFMDIFSRKIIGQKVHTVESMDLSSKLITEICAKENISKDELTLHSDNGGPMRGATMLTTLQFLGIVPSFSRPRVSDDNPYSESLFKTLKYCPQYPSKAFSSLEDAQGWVNKFIDWYNNSHLHSGIKFVTPNDRHEGKDKEILNRRKIVYETARLQNPLRWSGKIKNFDYIEKVYLNHLQKENKIAIKMAS